MGDEPTAFRTLAMRAVPNRRRLDDLLRVDPLARQRYDRPLDEHLLRRILVRSSGDQLVRHVVARWIAGEEAR